MLAPVDNADVVNEKFWAGLTRIGEGVGVGTGEGGGEATGEGADGGNWTLVCMSPWAVGVMTPLHMAGRLSPLQRGASSVSISGSLRDTVNLYRTWVHFIDTSTRPNLSSPFSIGAIK